MALFRSYTKMNEADQVDYEAHRRSRKRIIIMTVSFIVLIVVVVTAIAFSTSHGGSHDSHSKPAPVTSSSDTIATTLRTVCNVTLYPSSCFDTLSPLVNSTESLDPATIFHLSIQVAINQLEMSSKQLGQITVKNGTGKMVTLALKNCEDLMILSLERLNDTVSTKPDLTSKDIVDSLKTWLSSVITYQHTCIDGFQNATIDLQSLVKNSVHNSTEVASNSLAILSTVAKFLEGIGLRRRLLSSGDEVVPSWVAPRMRKLLRWDGGFWWNGRGNGGNGWKGSGNGGNKWKDWINGRRGNRWNGGNGGQGWPDWNGGNGRNGGNGDNGGNGGNGGNDGQGGGTPPAGDGGSGGGMPPPAGDGDGGSGGVAPPPAGDGGSGGGTPPPAGDGDGGSGGVTPPTAWDGRSSGGTPPPAGDGDGGSGGGTPPPAGNGDGGSGGGAPPPAGEGGNTGAGTKANLVVAADGSGDYTTISEAVAAAPEKSTSIYVIYVKEGTYVENVMISSSKWNIMMFGDGMDKTIVSGSLNAVDGTPTYSTATFAVKGKGFMARDMGFYNTAGAVKHQAVAMMCDSDLAIFYRCRFDAHQDTLYVHSGRQFYKACDVYGTVDFIFGNAATVLQSCNILPKKPMKGQKDTITAQGRTDPNQNTGISIHLSKIWSNDDLSDVQVYLGRPWKEYSTTVYLVSNLPDFIDPEGWLAWDPSVTPPDTILYGEYQNTGPGSKIDGRVTWKGVWSELSTEAASMFTVKKLLDGDSWIPQSGLTYEAGL